MLNKIRFLIVLSCCFLIQTKATLNYTIGETRSFNIPVLSDASSEANAFANYEEPVPDSILQLEAKIHALAATVASEGRFLDRLDALYEVTYPVGISKTIGGLEYIIILESDEITKEGAFVTAYMSFSIPGERGQLAFVANKIPLTAGGGINGIVELGLLKDEKVKLGENCNLVFYGQKGNSSNYLTKVHFDCYGFVDMVLDVGVEFNKNVFVCEDPKTGKQLPDKPFTANFITTVTSWNDLIVEINLPPFQIKQFKGFGFEVNQAALDFSDLHNPAGIIFPKKYLGIEAYGNLPELWRGFYFRQVTLRLPPEINEGNRINFMAQNMVIDDMGLSATFAMEPLLSLDQGSIGNWPFSIDRLELCLVANSVTKGGIFGQVSLPIQKDGDTVSYSAIVDQKGDFLFSISLPNEINVPMFVAKMTIDKTSTITIQKTAENYAITASLNGQINLNAPMGNASDKETAYDQQRKGFSLSGLSFQDLALSTVRPNFHPGIWSLNEIGFKSDAMNGFAISLSNIQVDENPEGDVGIRFTGRVNFSGNKYCAAATLSIWAEEKINDSGRSKWKYKKTQVHDVYLRVEDETVSIEGYFVLYNDDPKYGDGFGAKVSIKVIKALGLTATAMFGEVNDFKYFYVDAFVDLSNTPITMGAIAFYGFGGGMYYHMRQIPLTDNPLAFDPDEIKTKPIINYEPDKSTFLGFKATVAVGTAGNPTPFNAKVTFEIAFNSNGGIKMVALYGDGYFMSPIDLTNPAPEAPIRASVYIGFDVDNRIFHSSLKVYVNVAGGTIKGINPGGLAGEAVIHVEPHEWYIHIGRPATRVGLEMNVFGLKIASGSYFMMGTQIDDMPPPPDKVLALLKLDPPQRPEGTNMSLRGFCFGTQFTISTGNMNYIMFYATFELGLGFDLILADRSQWVCANTGETPGFKGWYAEGQAYAYIEGKIGIDIKVLRKEIKADILDVGAAALLEAKLPNPFWMHGAVGGYYNLLGGRIKGECNFDFEVGELCVFVEPSQPVESNPVEGLAVISAVTPDDGGSNIDVFSAPQVVFNYQVNSAFTISDEIQSPQQFKVAFDYFKVLGPDGIKLQGEYVWNNDNNVLVFNPTEILPGEAKLRAEAVIHFEELVNNVWKPVMFDGAVVKEEKICEFTTGPAPDYIPSRNVLYSYPLNKMMNFYKNESSSGYVQLRQGQDYLFTQDKDWLLYGRFVPVSGGNPVYVEFSYSTGQNKVTHIIPASLQNGLIYKFDLVSIPASEAGAIDQNIYKETKTKQSKGGTMTMTETKAQGSYAIEQEKLLYSCTFRSSRYNSMNDKLKNLDFSEGLLDIIPGGVTLRHLVSRLYIDEPFDLYEVGDASTTPMLRYTALEQGYWLKTFNIPNVYKDYPYTDYSSISWRNISEYGLVPLKAVNIALINASPRILNNDEAASGIYQAEYTYHYLNYKLEYYSYGDYEQIYIKLMNGPTRNSAIGDFLSKPFYGYRWDYKYPVKITYMLPDGSTGTTTEVNIDL